MKIKFRVFEGELTVNPKLRHLKKIDERILRLWVEAEGQLSQDQSGLFLSLLEKRVQLLKVLRESGEKLNPDVCVPSWLERFTRGGRCFSLRDLKQALAATERELGVDVQ